MSPRYWSLDSNTSQSCTPPRCEQYDARVRTLREGDYTQAKESVNALRAELRLAPARSLQSVFDEKSAKYVLFFYHIPTRRELIQSLDFTSYLQERQLVMQNKAADKPSTADTNYPVPTTSGATPTGASSIATPSSSQLKRTIDNTSDGAGDDTGPAKKRGRPKGSKNKSRTSRD